MGGGSKTDDWNRYACWLLEDNGGGLATAAALNKAKVVGFECGTERSSWAASDGYKAVVSVWLGSIPLVALAPGEPTSCVIAAARAVLLVPLVVPLDRAPEVELGDNGPEAPLAAAAAAKCCAIRPAKER